MARSEKALAKQKTPSGKEIKSLESKRTSYDRILKKTLQHDNELTIRLINGLFMAENPLGAEVVWLDKETVDEDDKSLIADFYVRVGLKMFAIEVEANDRGRMAFRSSQYAIRGAFLHNAQGTDAIIGIDVPDSCTVFLLGNANTPKELVWNISFRGSTYQVSNPTVRLSEMSAKEISDNNLFPIGQFLPRIFVPLTDENSNIFLKTVSGLLRELKKAMGTGVVSHRSGVQMQETILKLARRAIKNGKKKGLNMKLDVLETLDWIDYNEVFNEIEDLGIAEGEERGIARGKELGLVEGRELGIAEGKELGIVEGKELGIELNQIEAALNAFRNLQLEPEQIAEILRGIGTPEQIIEDARIQVEKERAYVVEAVPEAGECGGAQ